MIRYTPYFFYLRVLSFCLFLSSLNGGQITSNDQKEDVFNAVCSLYFHLEDLLDAPKEESTVEESIVFTQHDVSQLWDRACLDPAIFHQMTQAKRLYYLALCEKKERSKQMLQQKAHAMLDQVWNIMRAELTPPSSYESSGGGFFWMIKTSGEKRYPYLQEHPFLNREVQEKILPYLLPDWHSLRVILDKLFDSPGILTNEKTFQNAGFYICFHAPFSLIKVASHSEVPGYLFKVYLDCTLGTKEKNPGWIRLARRCEAANNIRNLINHKQLKYFQVPDKWLYPLPYPGTEQSSKKAAQPVVLVVTNMNLASQSETVKAWKKKITKEHLHELYCILSHGYSSTALIKNIPYTKNGMFACIDTEWPQRKMDYAKVNKFLSPKMRNYWNQLVRKGGKSS